MFAAVLTATPVLAQQGQGSRPPLRILSEESVQKELQLTPEQIQRVAVEFKKMRDAQEDIQILERDERAKAMKELIQKSDQVVASILTRDQAKRFRQITLQLQGLRTFFSPEFAKEMKATPEQTAQIKKIKQDTDAEKRELQKGAAGSLTANEARKKMAEINKKADTRIEALLTPEQKTKWGSLIGKPFKGEIGFGPPGANKPGDK
jgi:Spy/CpxP family protein refolding chaperone